MERRIVATNEQDPSCNAAGITVQLVQTNRRSFCVRNLFGLTNRKLQFFDASCFEKEIFGVAATRITMEDDDDTDDANDDSEEEDLYGPEVVDATVLGTAKASAASSSDTEEEVEEDDKTWHKDLTVIWECDMVKKVGRRGKVDEKWQCLHCGKEYSRWNATKALRHVVRIGLGIEHCKAVVGTKYRERYMRLHEKINMKRDEFRRAKEEFEIEIEEHAVEATKALSTNRKRSRRGKKGGIKGNSNTVAIVNKERTPPSAHAMLSPLRSPLGGSTAKKRKILHSVTTKPVSVSQISPSYFRKDQITSSEKKRQSTLYDAANDSCDVKFADMILGEGLHFSLANSIRVQAFVEAVKKTSPSYKLPGDKQI